MSSISTCRRISHFSASRARVSASNGTRLEDAVAVFHRLELLERAHQQRLDPVFGRRDRVRDLASRGRAPPDPCASVRRRAPPHSAGACSPRPMRRMFSAPARLRAGPHGLTKRFHLSSPGESRRSGRFRRPACKNMVNKRLHFGSDRSCAGYAPREGCFAKPRRAPRPRTRYTGRRTPNPPKAASCSLPPFPSCSRSCGRRPMRRPRSGSPTSRPMRSSRSASRSRRLAAVVMVLALKRPWGPVWRRWPHLLIGGALVHGLALATAHKALVSVAATPTALVHAFHPILTAALGVALLGERFRWWQWLGFALGPRGRRARRAARCRLQRAGAAGPEPVRPFRRDALSEEASPPTCRRSRRPPCS